MKLLENLSTSAVKLPLITGLIAIFLVLLGIVSLILLPLQATPPAKIPLVIVSVPYPGAAPSEVQSEVIRELEDKLKMLKDYKSISSNAKEGLGVSVVRFYENIDVELAKKEVRDKAEMARAEFPKESEIFVISDIDFDNIPILFVTLTLEKSKKSREVELLELNEIANDLEDNMLNISGVSSIDKYGSLEKEVRIKLDPKRMQQYGLSFGQVTFAIQNYNLAFPGGTIDFNSKRLTVRVSGKLKRPKHLENIVLRTMGSKQIFLKDIAEVYKSTRRPESYARLNGKPSITLQVHHKVGSNIISLINKIKGKIEVFRNQGIIPKHLEISYSKDQSYVIWLMISQLGQSALFGGILVIIILYFGMGLRNAILIASAIPFSVLFCFSCQLFFDISMNNMTLFSLILILGMVVDGAIVVGENIYRHFEMGKDPMEAALDGIHEVGVAVIAADLTTIAAFLPMLFMTGILANWMKIMPMIVSFTLLGSIIVDHFILPVLARFFMRKSNTISKEIIHQKVQSHGLIIGLFERFLGILANHRIFSLIVSGLPGIPLGLYILRVCAPFVNLLATDNVDITQGWPTKLIAILAGTIFFDIIFRTVFLFRFGEKEEEKDTDDLAIILKKQNFLFRTYDNIMAFSLKHRIVVVVVSILALSIALLLPLSGYIEGEFFGDDDNGMGFIHYELPPGSSLEENYSFAIKLEKILKETLHTSQCVNPKCDYRGKLMTKILHCPKCGDRVVAELKSYVITMGNATDWFFNDRPSGQEFGSIEIELVPLSERLPIKQKVKLGAILHKSPLIQVIQKKFYDENKIVEIQKARTIFQIMEVQKKWLKGRFPGVKISFEAQSDGPPVGDPILIRVTGKELRPLVEVAKTIEDILKSTNECRNIKNSHYEGRIEIRIKPKLDIASRYGITTRDISNAVFTAFHGLEASKMTLDDREVDIRIENQKNSREFYENISQLELISSSGQPIALQTVADIILEPGVSRLSRYNLMQSITISSQIMSGANTELIKQRVKDNLLAIPLPPGVLLKWGGSEEEHQESMRSLKYAFNIAIVLIFFIMVGQFNSIKQPFVVMTTIPLSIVGSIVGLYLTGNKLSFLAMVGIVCLAGIVVNDAIVLVDFLNKVRRKGVPLKDAIALAGRARLRPILMTTITTVVGLLPLTLNLTGGGAFWEDMGYSIISGLLVATVLTLVVIPTFYSLVERDRWQPWFLGKIFRPIHVFFYRKKIKHAIKQNNIELLSKLCFCDTISSEMVQEQAKKLCSEKRILFCKTLFSSIINIIDTIKGEELYSLGKLCKKLSGCTWHFDSRLKAGLREEIKDNLLLWIKYDGKAAPLGSFIHSEKTL